MDQKQPAVNNDCCDKRDNRQTIIVNFEIKYLVEAHNVFYGEQFS